jgi:sialate O-acetylesterase
MRGSIGAFVLVLSLGMQGQVSWADIKLPAVIGNHMVLQRNQPIPVWGWAEPGEHVVVRFAGTSCKTTADRAGRWRVTMAKLEAASEPRSMYIEGSGGCRIELTDILVGEVWFCTGPSNIFWPVRKCDNADEEIRRAKYPHIRFFNVERKTAGEPQNDCVGHWFICSSHTVGDVSGIGYFFSRRIHQALDVPIGLLQSYWGGSRIEAWTSRDALEAEPAVKPILDWWQEEFRRFDPAEAQTRHKKQMDAWRKAAAQAKSNDLPPPKRPAAPEDPRVSRHRPACLFNGMVAPLIPYSIRGVICYQGLGNLFWADYSAVLLETMVRDWRTRWAQGDFPVGLVQPAPYDCSTWPQSVPDAYSVQREAQLIIRKKVSNIGIAPTMDIDAVDVLHFTNKQVVARRLASWALATVYGFNLPYAGPVYDSMTIEGRSVRIQFRNTGSGLTTSDGCPPRHFKIAGPKGEYYPAEARIDGATVVLQSEHVTTPTTVRFAFEDTAVVNLTNRDGFPASLFRTDAVASAQNSGNR